MAETRTLEIPIQGMDCAECALHVEHAVAALPGVETVQVSLMAEKAMIRLDPLRVDVPAIRRAVEQAGYSVPEPEETPAAPAPLADLTRRVGALLGVVVGVALFALVVGEMLGGFDALTRAVPWPVWLALVWMGGYPVFNEVIRAALQRQITSHTLMTVGLVAALVVGEWPTAVLIVFFMRLGRYVEGFTTGRARRALKDLMALAPQQARVERDGVEQMVPASAVNVAEVVIVRPGEEIPVDGEVVSGHATVNQAAITGESIPVEAGPGTRVFAATIAQLGSLRVRAVQVGAETTFGRVIQLVEEAETHRAGVQRIADKFSAYYLPLVLGIAILTFWWSSNALAATAVLVVACSCSFALATPIAMLASIGAGARRGLLIKGGKYLETLARADVLLIDKTGTLTLGQPRITDVIPLDPVSETELLTLAASAERYSEHPLAEALRSAAQERRLPLIEPLDFTATPGMGVQALLDGRRVVVGSRRMVPLGGAVAIATALEAQGKTLLFVAREGRLIGILAVADTLRPEVPQALQAVRDLGVQQIELLTGDNERTAAALGERLGVAYRAGLLPEDKIAIVKEYQRQGHTVIMVGDGINDAPALAQADVGMAMGAAGSDVAIEAAHIVLMRSDWGLVPEALRIARRTLRVVKLNIGFTGVYNLIGLSLAALGFLPPALAAAAQSLPDFIILGNSSRLLRQRQ
ncbi:MAG: cadmium-translocating P-type ATPase [Chloroflexi bacterium]|nr:cadmium-translocating P-type ATPase [Chloroflexota bacterium]